MRDELTGKRILILGLARQGKALARFAAQIGAKVIVSDMRQKKQLQADLEDLSDIEVEIYLGDHPLTLLEDVDVLALSGGVPTDLPIVQEAKRRGITLTNDSLEFMKRVPGTVIGITGSAGKTTTTALTGAMVEATDRQAWIGGNIGRPLISELDRMEDGDVIIQELSSFQLELWTCSPQIAAILNITPNHLDRHGNMDAYSAAKSNILRFQAADGVAVLSADDPGAFMMRDIVQGRLRHFSMHLQVEDGAFVRRGKVWLVDGEKEWAVCDLEMIPLRGWHNVLNVLASTVLAHSVGVPTEAMRQAIISFSGVEHRLELVRTIAGVQYVNDSIATAPERAIAAIEAFEEPLVLLAGGRDKDMIWETWAENVLDKVKAIVLFGELADQLHELLLDSRASSDNRPVITKTKTMEKALEVASDLAEPGDVVLLAPGGTSFDAYVDFAERGVVFRQSVHALADRKISNS